MQQDAKRAVASMLERAGMTDRIRNVMSLLLRYETLFRLPSRILQETERGEFGTVSSCYSLPTRDSAQFSLACWDADFHSGGRLVAFSLILH